ncbi:MAG: SAM-dependent methyltransferase [Actinomycetia bacterium]|nr:SAM-dependent methyltransferase [Actinomycetes bacterium]
MRKAAKKREAAVATPSFDPEVPSIARTYDYLLGGKDHFPADREIGEIFVQRFPGAVAIAQDNRACLVRAVRYIANDLGIDQFLDLGSGLPTADNVHEVAQRANSAARVGYVDIDPVVLAHGRALLQEDDQTVVIGANITDPRSVLGNPELGALLDFSRPVAIIASAILHHLTDDEDPLGVIGTYKDALPEGSCLFVSSFRTLGDPESAELEEVLHEAFGRGTWRTDAQIAGYFAGTDIVEPGIVPCAQWYPEADPGELTGYQRLIVAGLGRNLPGPSRGTCASPSPGGPS